MDDDARIGSVLSGYADRAADLIEPYETLTVPDIYASVLGHMPKVADRVLDLGAATGRDAAWCAARGATVVAVEPVTAFRAAAQARHLSPRITWLEDRLPDLAAPRALGLHFSRILCSGVWHHLPPGAQARAMRILTGLATPQARLILSLRHGSAAPGRPAWPCKADSVIRMAEVTGFRLLEQNDRHSIQAGNRDAGVTWTWLVLEAP